MINAGDVLHIKEGVQYDRSYLEYYGDYLEYCNECSVPWGISSVQWKMFSPPHFSCSVP